MIACKHPPTTRWRTTHSSGPGARVARPPAADRGRSAGNALHRRALTVGRLLRLALGLAFACALAHGLADAKSDREVPVPASGDAARTRIAEIRAYMQRVKNTFMATGRVHLYARVSGQTTLIRVPDSRLWPEATEASYNVVHDLRDRVVAFVEVPTSESGDAGTCVRRRRRLTMTTPRDPASRRPIPSPGERLAWGLSRILERTTAAKLGSMVFVTVLGAVCGLIGGGLGRRI